jgi:hypothetical protein
VLDWFVAGLVLLFRPIDNLITMENQTDLQVSTNLKRARIDPHINKNVGAITKRNSQRSFEMTEILVFPFCLLNESDTGRRSDGEKVPSNSRRHRHQQPLSFWFESRDFLSNAHA